MTDADATPPLPPSWAGAWPETPCAACRGTGDDLDADDGLTECRTCEGTGRAGD